MTLLTRYFGSPEKLAKEIVKDDSEVIRIWKAYLASVKEKGALIASLKPDKLLYATRIKQLISEELIELDTEKKTEKDLLADLTTFSHEQRHIKTTRLEAMFFHTSTYHEYVHTILGQLLNTLTAELAILVQLERGSKQPAELVEHLQALWTNEKKLFSLIKEKPDFHVFFLRLLKREHIVHVLTTSEQRLIARLNKISPRESPDAVVNRWGDAVSATVREILEDYDKSIAEGLDPNDPNVDFEFVNRPAFVATARKALESVRGKNKILGTTRNVTEATVNTFVHLFREYFNNRPEQG